MQRINLLPEDLAPPGLNEELLVVLRMAGIAFAAVIVLAILLVVGLRLELARKNRILSKIMTKVKESDLLAENIEDLRSQASELQQELVDINVYLSGGVVWSEKLMQISALIPEEVWLRQISFKRSGGPKDFLNLQGSLVSLEGLPLINTLSAFVNKIKADKAFFADFDDLLVTDIKTDKKQDVDVMDFKIKLLFKK